MANIAAAVERGLSWAVPATRQERAAALWSFGYFFALLAGYYVLRPLRDQMGIAGGVRNLPWLFTATFVALIIAQPLYGALVAKLPRARFIPLVYHFFVANLALFWLFLVLGQGLMAVHGRPVHRRAGQAPVRVHRRRRHRRRAVGTADHNPAVE